ncbi:regulator of chromosome condensation 1/beta-lactamase-inhibitor protein II [Xylariaceae sp. FL0016]|nr:regulator of chromosome condensation 1/beta-lactamase-inhibitor protein II [Xylariaceae sp. FL0016]
MHTVAINADNKIITWGVNDNCALGRNTQYDGNVRNIDAKDEEGELSPLKSAPTEIPSDCFPADTRFIQVAAGDSCSFALTDTGLVYVWGTFLYPQGDAAFRRDDSVKIVQIQEWPVRIPLQNITQITYVVIHALALDNAGNIWAWGRNDQYQFGRRLLVNDSDTLIPRQCFVWGRIDDGQLGIDFTPEQCQDSTLIRCDERNKPRICLRPTAIPDVENLVYVTCGTNHTIMIDKVGCAHATGYNVSGQLGFGSEDDTKVPKQMKSIVKVPVNSCEMASVTSGIKLYHFMFNGEGHEAGGLHEKERAAAALAGGNDRHVRESEFMVRCIDKDVITAAKRVDHAVA